MWPDQVLNPGPLTYQSGALPIALRGPAFANVDANVDTGVDTGGSAIALPELHSDELKTEKMKLFQNAFYNSAILSFNPITHSRVLAFLSVIGLRVNSH